MAAKIHLPLVTATQVGTYFVGQYYQILQAQPELVHQFYSDASTMIRVNGHTRETAAAMVQINTLVMSLNYAGVEIKAVHSLESWNRGILVMILGSVLINGFNDKKRFVQTIFLAPQETGYFVLNDIFHYIEEDAIFHHPVAYLGQNTLHSKVQISASIEGAVSNYMPKEETQSREFVAPADIKENGVGDNYCFSEEQLQKSTDVENMSERHLTQSDGHLQDSTKSVSDHVAAPVEDFNVEPQKHTYASILQVTKGPSITTTPPRSFFSKPAPATSEWDQKPELPAQQSVPSSTTLGSSIVASTKVLSAVGEEAEVKSVYVKSIPPTVSAYEIGEVFKKFGELKPDAVAIRRKDTGVCYAFVEFEDITGVKNAIQASTVELAGQKVFIEGRRANRGYVPLGARIGSGRGRGGYHIEISRSRFAPRNFGQRNGQEREHDLNRPRANGLDRPVP